jgi:methionine-rich copper-binding protein CopC
MNKFAKALAAVVIAIAGVLPAQAAFAHAELETSNPEANSVIGSAPGVVSLTFGEKLMVMTGEDAANQVQVTDASNARVDNGDYQVTGEVLTVSLKTPTRSPTAWSLKMVTQSRASMSSP